MKLKLIPLLLISCLVLACNKNSSSNEIYFGGLIINPTSKFVILLKKDVVVDTFYLDSENKFGGNLQIGDKGMYVFRHPPENQIIYLEPGDSTLLRLNTLDFDESLTFSGKGAEKSNYLSKMYLLNQGNNNLILSCFKLTPTEFAKKTDSIRESRITDFNAINKRNNFSDEFVHQALETINFEFYDLRERYSYLIRNHAPEEIENIPSDFHDYRKNINFNDEALEDNYIFLNFLDDYLRTTSLENCVENDLENVECLEITNIENIKGRIFHIDSLLKNDRIKNTFINNLVSKGIIYSKNREEILSMLSILDDINYSGNRRGDLQQMAGIQNSLLPGKNLGELKLLDKQKDTVLLKNISNKPTITYHWSLQARQHYRYIQKTIEELRVKYPEIDFIGINIDYEQQSDWADIIKGNDYNPSFEYKLSFLNINEVLLKNYLDKLIFLDASGTIVRGDIRITSLDYESKILEFISK